MMTIKFVKMHGLGNHFVIINNFVQTTKPEQLRLMDLANPQTGIGFDQLILVGPSKRADLNLRFFNADGREAEQCGNGLRCAVRFALDENILTKTKLTIETLAGVSEAEVLPSGLISVQLGIPIFNPADVPFKAETQQPVYDISLPSDQQTYKINVLSLGNPHAVIQVADVKSFAVEAVGKQIATSPLFPRGTNVGFMQIIDRQHILLRTYERGCGETLACGSNTCATVIAAILNGDVDNQVDVQLALGKLRVQWDGLGKVVHLIGPTATSFRGELLI